MKNSRKGRLYRQLLTATLLFGGTFNLVAPAMAAGTAAGTTISNTATGTYTDSNDPTSTPINATSNTVTITVAEVAGIDVSALSQPASVNPGGTANYDFRVTNTGNDPTKFVLPTNATLTGTGAASGTVTSIIVAGPDGQLGTADDVTLTPGSAPYDTGSIAANGTLDVRVVVTVAQNATAGKVITVEYGKSANPASTNQDYVPDGTGNAALDLYTQDNSSAPLPAGETAGSPINGVREDSASLNATIAATTSVFNGPNGQPLATGDGTNTNTDFTSKSSTVPTNISPGTSVDPTPVSFTNTIQNSSNATQAVTLQPTVQTGMSLPPGTTVTITDPNNTTATAKYTYTNGAFSLTTGTPVTINVPQSSTANYTVVVDMPVGTKLSTDMTTSGNFATAVGGYSVPITAFIDGGTANGGTAGVLDATDIQNISIDTTYVGFLAMYKDARILASDGTTELQTYTTDQTLLTAKFQKGNIVEYRIQYKNISKAAASTSYSIPSTANRVVITEDGTTYNVTNNPKGNNWALDNDGNNVIDTSNKSFNGTNVTTTTVNGEITSYTDTINTVAPGGNGSLIIQRTIN